MPLHTCLAFTAQRAGGDTDRIRLAFDREPCADSSLVNDSVRGGTMKMRAIVIALVAAAALGADAAAQIATGNIMGAVKDEQSGALPGALVTLKGVDATQTATTDNTGEFRFLNLAPGAYSLTISLPGFKTFVRDGLVVAVGRNVDVPV